MLKCKRRYYKFCHKGGAKKIVKWVKHPHHKEHEIYLKQGDTDLGQIKILQKQKFGK